MLYREMEAWAALNPDAVRGVRTQGRVARRAWSYLIMTDREVDALGPWCPSGQFCPAHAVGAAVNIAIELAIVVALWSERPSWL
jgi:hypothetical protein